MHIIMNPPYSRNLHLKILREAMKHIKPENKVVCLHPKNYYESLSVYYNPKNFPFTRDCWTHLDDYNDISREDAQRLFSTGFNTLNLIIGTYCSNAVRGDAWTESDRDLRKKMRSKYKEPACGFDNIRISRKKISGKKPYVLFNQYNTDKIEDYFADEKSNVSYGIEFNTQNELKNWKSWLLSSKIPKWLLSKKSCGFIVPCVDFSHPWTDDMLYKYFGLTDDEIKTIENEVKENDSK